MARRLPIAARLLAAVAVPLLALVGVLVVEVADARAEGAVKAVEIDRVELLRAVAHLQGCPLHPELVEYGMWPRRGMTVLQATAAVEYREYLNQRCREAVDALAVQLPAHGGLLGVGGRAALEAEIRELRPFLAEDAGSLEAHLPDMTALRAAREAADAAMSELMLSFDGPAWLVYRASVDITRSTVSESAAVHATLLGLGTVEPLLLSSLRGARNGSVNDVDFGTWEQVRRDTRAVLGSPTFREYEAAVARAGEIAAGRRGRDTPMEFLVAANAARMLSGQVQDLEAAAEGLDRAALEADVDRAASRARMALVLAVVVLILTLAAAVAVLRSVLGPLRDLTRRAKELGAGRLDGRPVNITGRDELTRLGIALEHSAGTLRHVNEQATAIAEGRLDDPSLDRPAPGVLGEVLHQNVLAVRSMASRLQHDADHDPLTGLLNRAALERHARNLHDSGQRWLLYLDLDGFKPINDEFGHLQGDDVLRSVAQRLLRALRPGDLVARVGGDEFAVILTLESDAPLTELDATVRRLAEAVRAPVPKRRGDGVAVRPDPISVGVSIGRAHLAAQTSLAAAFATADAEMYVIKQAGRAAAVALKESATGELPAPGA